MDITANIKLPDPLPLSIMSITYDKAWYIDCRILFLTTIFFVLFFYHPYPESLSDACRRGTGQRDEVANGHALVEGVVGAACLDEEAAEPLASSRTYGYYNG